MPGTMVIAGSSRLLRTNRRTATGRAAAEMRRRVGLDIRRLRIDAGLSVRTLAAASGIDHGFLARIEAGSVEASYAVLVAIGEVLGADLSVRPVPHDRPTGSTIAFRRRSSKRCSRSFTRAGGDSPRLA